MTEKKFKHFVIRTYYRIVNPFRHLYWFIFRPKTRGVKAVIFWEGKVLLARISYGHRSWALPGGGVEKRESFRDAALREAKEEVGIEANNAEFIYEYHSTYQHKRNTVQCFAVQVSSGNFAIDEQEITEAGWFFPNELPAGVRSTVKDVLSAYSEWQRNRV
jgi:ADP-ribose pyrophosphatase YjhB (NUDIX family)